MTVLNLFNLEEFMEMAKSPVAICIETKPVEYMGGETRFTIPHLYIKLSSITSDNYIIIYREHIGQELGLSEEKRKKAEERIHELKELLKERFLKVVDGVWEEQV